MSKISIICLATLGMTTLTACGGSGSNASFATLSENQMVDLGNRLISDYGTEPATSTMPTGSATFMGVGAASLSGSTPSNILATATSIYQVEANVNFSSGTLSGSAYNFKSTVPGITFSGVVPFTGNVSGSGFTGSYDGTLDQQGMTVSYRGTVSGDFVGDNADAMIGVGTGVQSAPGFTSQTVYSYWGAERQ